MAKSYVTRAHRDWLAGEVSTILDEEACERSISNILGNVREWQDGLSNADIEFQVAMLGLTPADIRSLAGQRVLDIGCGRDANLVHWLRELDIEAEGIDPIVEGESSFLMRQAVNGFSDEGKIPRPDGYYAMVLAHLSTAINRGLSKMASINPNPPADEILRGTSVVLDGLRVLAPSGRLVCWPGIGRTEYMGAFLRAEEYVHTREILFEGLPTAESQMVGDANYRSTIRKN